MTTDVLERQDQTGGEYGCGDAGRRRLEHLRGATGDGDSDGDGKG